MIQSVTPATTPAPQDLAISDITILIDTREQAPYSFAGFHTDKSSRGGRRPLIVQTRVVGLQTGDYSIEGFQDRVAVERKSLEDLYGTLGGGRERFQRELERLAAMDRALVVVEANWGGMLSRICHACDGSGLRHDLGVSTCIACNGTGKTHPVERSKLDPKTVFRSVIAWQIEYPTIHWVPADSRRIAESYVFRWLSRWNAKRAGEVQK